jgi:Fe2+ transport system protein B
MEYDCSSTAKRLKIVNDNGRYMHRAMAYQGEEFIPLMIGFTASIPCVIMATAAIPKDKVIIPLDSFLSIIPKED